MINKIYTLILMFFLMIILFDTIWCSKNRNLKRDEVEAIKFYKEKQSDRIKQIILYNGDTNNHNSYVNFESGDGISNFYIEGNKFMYKVRVGDSVVKNSNSFIIYLIRNNLVIDSFKSYYHNFYLKN